MRVWVESSTMELKDLEASSSSMKHSADCNLQVGEGGALKGRCENLQEEYQYRFRTIAVNKAGKSEPGPSSDTVTAMHKNIPPFIKGDGLTDLSLKDGKKIFFDLWVGGEPAPVIEWYRDDIKLCTDDYTNIDVYTKYSSAYTLKNAVLSIPRVGGSVVNISFILTLQVLEGLHDGMYKLRLRNESGVFEAVANVKIDGEFGRRRKEEEEKKVRLAKELQEQKEREKIEKAMREERERVEREMQELERLNFARNSLNRKLSQLTNESKDEDKDSGMKIGEDSEEVSEYEEYSEEDEDFYEEETLENKQISEENMSKGLQENTSSHTITNGNDEVELEMEKLGDGTTKVGGEGGQRRTSDYTDSFDSQIPGMDDESVEKEGTLDKCVGKVLENANNASNCPKMLEGSESGPGKSNDTRGESDQQECSVDRWAHENSNNSWGGDTTDIGQDVFENNTDTNDKETEYGSYQNWYGSSTGQGWGDEQNDDVFDDDTTINSITNTTPDQLPNNVEIIVDDEEQQEEGYSSYQNYYGCGQTPTGMGWYDNADDTEDYKQETTNNQLEANDTAFATADSERVHEPEPETEPEPEPEPAFDPEQHMQELQEQLDSSLTNRGFTRSDTVVQPELVTGGDGCLVSLLDQMNREGQDFKVWERDDFSFLRWYVTKQMESLIAKVGNLKFTEAVQGDVQDYIDLVANDGVHLDTVFVQAVATIFNKDIVLVQEDGDRLVVAGGIDGNHGKGIPLYLGHVRGQQGKNKDIFISIFPSSPYGEQIACQVEATEDESSPSESTDSVQESATEDKATSGRGWKRMDSYNPRDSKDMDQLIKEMEGTEGYGEVVNVIGECDETEEETQTDDNCNVTESKKIDKIISDDKETGEEEEQDYDNSSYQNFYWNDGATTQGMGWYDTTEEENDDTKDVEVPAATKSGDDTSADNETEEQEQQEYDYSSYPSYYGNSEVTTQGMGWYDGVEEETCGEKEENTQDNLEVEAKTAEQLVSEDVEDEESCEGWTYDNETGYWIQNKNEVFEEDIDLELQEEKLLKEAEDEADAAEAEAEAVELLTIVPPEMELSEPEGDVEEFQISMDEVKAEAAEIVKEAEQSEEEMKESQTSVELLNKSEILVEIVEDTQISVEDVEESQTSVEELKMQLNDNYEKTTVEIDIPFDYSSNEENKPDLVERNEETEIDTECQELIEKDPVNETADELSVAAATSVEADAVTSSNSCEGHTGLDGKEDRDNSPVPDKQPATTKIVRKIKIQASVSERPEQVTPCSNPLDSQPIVSTCPPSVTHTHTDTAAPVITDAVSGVWKKAPELSKTDQQTENTKEDINTCKHTEEAMCKNIPDVCVETDVSDSFSSEAGANEGGDGGNCLGHIGTTKTVSSSNGLTAEVTMRAPLRKYSSKRTASYRWSGTEMLQLEGERTGCASPIPVTPEITRKDMDATRANIAYKKTCVILSKKISKLGFSVSSTWDKENAKSGDNCLRALIDQICQPYQDFKVWDREDHGFLRWYLAKQVEIQVAGGRADHFLRGQAKAAPKEFIEKCGKDDEYMNNDFLFATARVLNKDIYVVESTACDESVLAFRGGPGGGPGKGAPLLMAHLASQEAGGRDYYQSLLPMEGSRMETLLATLPVTEQRS